MGLKNGQYKVKKKKTLVLISLSQIFHVYLHRAIYVLVNMDLYLRLLYIFYLFT